MSRSLRYPRNEASRRDKILSREIIFRPGRDHKTRNDMLAGDPHKANVGLTIALSGTAIAGGLTEEMIVDGGETVIVTVANDTWAPTLGADNAITTAFLAAITGDDAGGNGFDDEVALVHGNLVRTSDTVVTLTLPASASYSVAADETIEVDPPTTAYARGVKPTAAAPTFDVTANVKITLSGTMVAGGVLESEVVSGGVDATLIVTLAGDTWASTLGGDNQVTVDFLAAITGDLPDAAGWNIQVSATLAHGDLTRTSDTVVTLIGPAVAGYAITSDDEVVTVAPPSDSFTGTIVPVAKSFTITEGS